MGRGKRHKAQPTDEWQELLPLFEWPEQEAYEELRPVVLFGVEIVNDPKPSICTKLNNDVPGDYPSPSAEDRQVLWCCCGAMF